MRSAALALTARLAWHYPSAMRSRRAPLSIVAALAFAFGIGGRAAAQPPTMTFVQAGTPRDTVRLLDRAWATALLASAARDVIARGGLEVPVRSGTDAAEALFRADVAQARASCRKGSASSQITG